MPGYIPVGVELDKGQAADWVLSYALVPLALHYDPGGAARSWVHFVLKDG